MQVKLRNVKSGEIGTAFFPLERPDDFSFDTWQVVDLVRPGEEEFEESDIRCASLIYDIEPDKLPGKGEKDSSEELHLFLKDWKYSLGTSSFVKGRWRAFAPRVYISLINVTGYWRRAAEICREVDQTGIEPGNYRKLGEYYLEKYRYKFSCEDNFELESFFRACIEDEGFLNVEEYGRRIADNPQNGYWASDLKCWVDCSESDEWKYWVEYGE